MTSVDQEETINVTELKYSIETAKIKSLVVDMISKLQIALCFPSLSEMPEDELKELSLKDREIMLIKRLLKADPEKRDEGPSDDLSEPSLLGGIDQIINNYTVRGNSMSRRTNEELCHLLYSLLRNEAVTQHCRDKLRSQISDQAYEFICHIQKLLEIILAKLQQPPEVVEQNEIELHQMFQYNEKAEDRFHNTKAELMLQAKANRELLKNCDKKLQDIERRIHCVYDTSEGILQKCTKEADYKMNWDWKMSEFKQEAMEEKAKNTEMSLEKLKKDNIIAEKELRVKRYKVEQQLKGILEKYDADMEDRQEQYDAISSVFKTEERALLDFNDKYYEQQTIYEELMKEKNAYEKKIWEDRLYVIQCKIAARKIQRFFRAFLFLVKEYGNTKKKKK